MTAPGSLIFSSTQRRWDTLPDVGSRKLGVRGTSTEAGIGTKGVKYFRDTEKDSALRVRAVGHSVLRFGDSRETQHVALANETAFRVAYTVRASAAARAKYRVAAARGAVKDTSV